MELVGIFRSVADSVLSIKEGSSGRIVWEIADEESPRIDVGKELVEVGEAWVEVSSREVDRAEELIDSEDPIASAISVRIGSSLALLEAMEDSVVSTVVAVEGVLASSSPFRHWSTVCICEPLLRKAESTMTYL